MISSSRQRIIKLRYKRSEDSTEIPTARGRMCENAFRMCESVSWGRFQICLQNVPVENRLYLFPLAIKCGGETLTRGGWSPICRTAVLNQLPARLPAYVAVTRKDVHTLGASAKPRNKQIWTFCLVQPQAEGINPTCGTVMYTACEERGPPDAEHLGTVQLNLRILNQAWKKCI